MTEIFIKFDDYIITYPPCETGTVAYARVTAWLTRYPHAKVIEKFGRSERGAISYAQIKILVDEKVPPELRRAG